MARDDNVDAKEYGEIFKARRRGYVRVGDVKSLTHQLSLPKGKYIMMIYNGTCSILNTSLWAPHFALPMVGSNICDV